MNVPCIYIERVDSRVAATWGLVRHNANVARFAGQLFERTSYELDGKPIVLMVANDISGLAYDDDVLRSASGSPDALCLQEHCNCCRANNPRDRSLAVNRLRAGLPVTWGEICAAARDAATCGNPEAVRRLGEFFRDHPLPTVRLP